MIFKKTEGFYTRYYWAQGERKAFIRHAFGLIPEGRIIILSPEASMVWRWMGRGLSLRILQEEFFQHFRKKLTTQGFRTIIAAMRKNKLIASRENSIRLKEIKDDFSNKATRDAVYDGVFYKKNPAALRRALAQCFASVKIKMPGAPGNKRGICGIIVPHSNIEISGPCAAHAYKAIMRSAPPDLFVLMGPNHTGSMRFPYAVLAKDFVTPLGLMRTDKDFCSSLQANSGFDIFADSITHKAEHSLELQILFLQYLYAAHVDRLKILPVVCSGMEALKMPRSDFINALKKTVAQSGKRVVFIATGDLVHIGLAHRYSRNLFFHKKNREIIRLLKKAEPEFFLKALSSRDYGNFCGRAPFYTLLRLIAPARGNVLNYTWRGRRLSVLRTKVDRVLANEDIGHASMVFRSRALK